MIWFKQNFPFKCRRAIIANAITSSTSFQSHRILAVVVPRLNNPNAKSGRICPPPASAKFMESVVQVFSGACLVYAKNDSLRTSHWIYIFCRTMEAVYVRRIAATFGGLLNIVMIQSRCVNMCSRIGFWCELCIYTDVNHDALWVILKEVLEWAALGGKREQQQQNHVGRFISVRPIVN